jgi:peptide/nickel transport system permease protein
VISFIVRRVLGAIPLLLFISIVTYAMMALAPGGPAAVLGPKGQGLSPEVVARINQAYGLDKPWYIQ